MRFKIPCLEKIAELARKYADQDPELQAAFKELELTEKEQEMLRKQRLETCGINCASCGKKFLPGPWDRGFCSLGCRFDY